MTVTLHFAELDTPMGRVRLAADGDHLVASTFMEGWDEVAEALGRYLGPFELEPADDPAGAVTAMRRYLDGDLAALDLVKVRLHGTPFQRRAWEAMRAIPIGQTLSYRDIALAAGAPNAYRAAGSASGANRLWLVVPCHRVVATGGGLGGYGGGLDRKQWLLEHERAGDARRITGPSRRAGRAGAAR